jgi:predicted Rossmann fold flavoprotein
MIAAGRAAELGAPVILLEKNRRTGRKLLITGGGRCNVTNDIEDRHTLVSRYGGESRGLHSPFARFPPSAMRLFLAEHGLETKVEDEGRVFPVTNSAASVRGALEHYMRQGGVELRTRQEVVALVTGGPAGSDGSETDDNVAVTGVRLSDDTVIRASAVILATGGVSRPETGSTGDGFRFLQETGHSVRIPEPSLVPVATREVWVSQLQGVSLPEAGLSAWLDGKRQFAERGKLLFTHFGLSGPLTLNLSSRINELAQGGTVRLQVDLFPATDGGEVERNLQASFDAESGKMVQNALGRLVPARMAATLLEQAAVDGATRCHSVTKQMRRALVTTCKGLTVTFKGLLGEEKAVVSSGGLSPAEIDFRTMESMRVSGLYVTGDLIDVDRRSGGYSLQLCWATGWVAGESAAERAAPISASRETRSP